jgi:hypothetical protein
LRFCCLRFGSELQPMISFGDSAVFSGDLQTGWRVSGIGGIFKRTIGTAFRMNQIKPIQPQI